ncbi:hypothetical protein [uncultured Paenibacillus sp.]|uniref:hypothetical protein n=1 Tax=uncultured Paenibacillus sp. TaxID=227322 RepID=UPI0025E7EEE7|nr:hypothetical protein [uncultured Paenibacillus sp.]
MRPHPEEMLHSYIILGLFAPSRSETGEIGTVLQDSLSGEAVPIELLYLRRILLAEQAYRISVPYKRALRNHAVMRISLLNRRVWRNHAVMQNSPTG